MRCRWPARRPPTAVRPGVRRRTSRPAPTPPTRRRTRDKSAAYRSMSAGRHAAGIGDDDGHRRRESWRNRCAFGLRPDAPTPNAAAPGRPGTPTSPRGTGRPSSSSRATTARPIGSAAAHHELASSGTRTAARPVCAPAPVGAAPDAPAGARPARPAAVPSSTIAAGVTTIAAIATKATVATPA